MPATQPRRCRAASAGYEAGPIKPFEQVMRKETVMSHTEGCTWRRKSKNLPKHSKRSEMRINIPRLKLRRRGGTGSADDLSRALLFGVWGLTFGHDVHYFAAYTDHCRNLLGLLTGHSASQADRNDIVELVEVVSADRDKPVAQIRDAIRKADPKWMISAADDESTLAALDFVVRLWLFVKPNLEDGTRTLSQAVAAELPEQAAFQQNSGHLSRDFCAKNLTRRGGIKIEWTSYLSDHLTFVGKARLRLFRHVSALQKYSRSKER